LGGWISHRRRHDLLEFRLLFLTEGGDGLLLGAEVIGNPLQPERLNGGCSSEQDESSRNRHRLQPSAA